MRETSVKLYQFDELSDDAKKVAINEMSDINVDYEWWQCTYWDAENIGLKITGFDLERNRHATGEFILSACEVAQNILNEHGEHCETRKTAQSFLDEWQPVFSDYLDESSENYESKDSEDKMIDIEENFLKSLLEDYAIILQNECDYLQSDEAIIETIQANEYEFTANGKSY